MGSQGSNWALSAPTRHCRCESASPLRLSESINIVDKANWYSHISKKECGQQRGSKRAAAPVLLQRAVLIDHSLVSPACWHFYCCS